MKQLLRLLAFITNQVYNVLVRFVDAEKLDKVKLLHICHIYGKYGMNAPHFIGMTSSPTVTSGNIFQIGYTGFSVGGFITNTGGENATVRGFCYITGTSGDPTISNSVVSQSGSYTTGAYSLPITGLTGATFYRVRAYATNSGGTGYGATITMRTGQNISSIEQLDAIRNNTATDDSGTAIRGKYYLTRNLDFNSDASYDNPANRLSYTTGNGWNPLGRASPTPWFGAHIDGQGFTIANLMVNDSTTGQSNSGLIGVADECSIENLGLINPRINANTTNGNFNQVGALVMGFDPVCKHNFVLVRNCFVRGGRVVGGDASNHNGTGGMIGIAHEYTLTELDITNCYVTGTEVVRNISTTNYPGVGGLVGNFNQISTGTGYMSITNCYAAAPVISSNNTNAGGLLGQKSNSRGTVSSSYWDTQVSGQLNSAGVATGRTTAQMMTQSTYTGWSITTPGSWTNQTWYIQSNVDYPRLGSQFVPTIYTPSAFFHTDFSSPPGTSITNHSGGASQSTWSIHPSYVDTMLISSGLLYAGGSTTTAVLASAVPPTPDYDISARMQIQTVLGFKSILGRMSPTALTFYMFRLDPGTWRWQLYKSVNGTFTLLAETPDIITVGNSYVYTLSMSGSTIKGIVNGVEKISVVDSEITAAGRIGIRDFGANETLNSGIHIDEMIAVNTGALASPPTVTTQSATNILDTSVTGNGNVTSDNGSAITERGFVAIYTFIGMPPTTTSFDVKVVTSGTTGVYSSTIGSLTANSQYTYRAYAKNAGGTSYGQEQTFITATANTPPTVALNTPDATVFNSGSTSLEFTGTDSQSNDIQYNVWIKDASTLSLVLSDQYSSSNRDGGVTLQEYSDTEFARGQIFTGNGAKLSSAAISIRRPASTSSVALRLLVFKATASTGNPSLYVPTGSPVAVSNAITTSGTIPTFTDLEFTFSGANKIALDNGVKYALQIEAPQGTFIPDNYFEIGVDSSSPSHSGNSYSYDSQVGEYVPTTSFDMVFLVRTESIPLISAVSGVNSGFTNTVDGADTNPFTSGQKISYTPTTPLSVGDYVWEVRAADPSGSNTYGQFSSTGTFSVISAGVTTGYKKVLVSGVWTPKPVKSLVGSTWTVKPVKKFNGSTWS